jgi:hypothetical protein
MDLQHEYLLGLREPVALRPKPPGEKSPPWAEPPLTPEELEARLAAEILTPAEKLAILEVIDPMPRPPKQPCWLDRVDFIDGVDRIDVE